MSTGRASTIAAVLGLLTIGTTSRHAVFNLYSQEPAPSVVQDSPAWTVLRQGVEDGDAKHRETAISAIGTIADDPEAVNFVCHSLNDKEADVRQTAAATLGQMHAHDAIPRLQQALDDKNPEVSFTAAKALWDLGDTSSRDIIQDVLTGERKNRPGKMASAKKEAKQKMHNPGELTLMGAKEGAGIFFGPAGAAISAIQEAMKENKKDSGAAGRAAAAAILAKDPDPYSLTLLDWALGDSNWAVRVAVAKALGERGDQHSAVLLSPLLSDPHHAVRYMAAASIVRLSLKVSNTSASNNGSQ